MKGAARRSWLIMGFSPGETLFVFAVLGVLTVVATRSVPAIMAEVEQTESVQMATRARVYWIERWANDGRDVTGTAPDFVYDGDGKYSYVMPDDAGDGSITVLFKDVDPRLADEAITFRPAFSAPGDAFSVAWVCGAARTPHGFTAVGENRTTLPNERLVSGCRSRP